MCPPHFPAPPPARRPTCPYPPAHERHMFYCYCCSSEQLLEPITPTKKASGAWHGPRETIFCPGASTSEREYGELTFTACPSVSLLVSAMSLCHVSLTVSPPPSLVLSLSVSLVVPVPMSVIFCVFLCLCLPVSLFSSTLSLSPPPPSPLPSCGSSNTARRFALGENNITMSAWLVTTRRAPSRHCRGARVYGHTTKAVH